jgi:hypothetical protein
VVTADRRKPDAGRSAVLSAADRFVEVVNLEGPPGARSGGKVRTAARWPAPVGPAASLAVKVTRRLRSLGLFAEA